MGNLIMPKNSAEISEMNAVLKVYYESDDWMDNSSFIDKMKVLLGEPIQEPQAYTKKTQIPSYFGFTTWEDLSNSQSKRIITESGKRFYEGLKAKDNNIIFKEIIYSLENQTFGRNVCGVSSDSDIEPPQLFIKCVLTLGYLTRQEYGYILWRLDEYNENLFELLTIIASNRIKNVKNYPDIPNKYGDAKPITALVNWGFLKTDNKINGQDKIIINPDVIANYLDRLQKLRIFNNVKNLNSSIYGKGSGGFDYRLYIESLKLSNLKFSDSLIMRFVASLTSKPFVILSGLSGSGKTKIAQSFVQWICEDNTQYKIVPVGADWTNREPLVGYPNGLVAEEYITPDSGVINLLLEAIKEENEDKPYFLILDEMNLSHVERYFADFLSIMESNDTLKLYTGNTRESLDGLPVPLEIGWPKNVFIIGTVNIDETTYMFSPKVLDRANVIEFRITDEEIQSFLANPGIPDLTKLTKQGVAMAESFLSIASQNSIVKNVDIAKELVSFFNQLQPVGAEFGYRSATEIMQLVAKLKMLEPSITNDECLDIAIMQKLLPKLHGSRSKLVKILIALAGLCIDGMKKVDFEKNFEELYKKDFEDINLKYSISFEKLIRMYKNVLANGFTSYAEA